MRLLLAGTLAALAALPASPCAAPRSEPAPASTRTSKPAEDSPRAFLLEITLRAGRLEAKDDQNLLGPALTDLRRNLQQAQLILAQGDTRRFDQVRAEIQAQLAFIDALVSRADVEGAVAQAELLLAQTKIALAEAEQRAKEAEARIAAPPSFAPGSAP